MCEMNKNWSQNELQFPEPLVIVSGVINVESKGVAYGCSSPNSFTYITAVESRRKVGHQVIFSLFGTIKETIWWTAVIDPTCYRQPFSRLKNRPEGETGAERKYKNKSKITLKHLLGLMWFEKSWFTSSPQVITRCLATPWYYNRSLQLIT